MKLLTKKYFSNWFVAALILAFIAMIGINLMANRNFNTMVDINNGLQKVIDQYEEIFGNRNIGNPL